MRFRSKPDLILLQGNPTVIVILQKRMAHDIDDAKQGTSEADGYQVMAHSQLYACEDVMLHYPQHGERPPNPICTGYAIARNSAEEVSSWRQNRHCSWKSDLAPWRATGKVGVDCPCHTETERTRC